MDEFIGFLYIILIIGGIILGFLFFRMLVDVNKIRHLLSGISNYESDINIIINVGKLKTMILLGKNDLAYELIVRKETAVLNNFIFKDNIKTEAKKWQYKEGERIIERYKKYYMIIGHKIPDELLSFDSYLKFYYQ